MKRRPFLHAAVGALATGGCLGRADQSSPADATTEMAAADSPLAVERVETFDYVVRLNDLGDDPIGTTTSVADLDDREREVVDAAIAGGYETDDPPEWLVQFASGTPFVEREGTYYRLDHTLPTTTITAENAAESDVDGAIADHDEYEAAVTHDGRILTGLLRIARREGIELTDVWPSLRNFLDAYDAVDYRGEVVSFSVDVEDSGPPYRLSASEVPVSEAVRGEVWDVSAADNQTRELVRRAGETGGAYGFDSAPEGFFERLDAHEYAYLDDTFYTTYVEKRGSAPVSLDASLADGTVRLSLRNDADGEFTVTSGAPKPFGVLYFFPVGDPDDRRLLWTDAYEESDYVETDGREIELINDIGLASSVAPGETLSEAYEVDASDLPSGEYAVEGSVGVESGDEGANVRYRVVFSA